MLGLGLSITSLTGRRAEHPLDTGPQVFACLGQSNMVGRASFDQGAVHPAGTLMWGREGAANNTLVAATVPLDHHDPGNGQMGLDIEFARTLAVAEPGRDLIFVPSADGGTGFSADRWNPGDDLYVDAVTRINAALSSVPDAVLAGILWHQGESDVGLGAAYQTRLDAMITQMRADITRANAATPIVLGEMVPGWVTAQSGRQIIQAIIADTPNRIPFTAVASSVGLTDRGDLIHFDAASLRTLGARYHAALVTARSNTGGQVTAPGLNGQISNQQDVLAA